MIHLPRLLTAAGSGGSAACAALVFVPLLPAGAASVHAAVPAAIRVATPTAISSLFIPCLLLCRFPLPERSAPRAIRRAAASAAGSGEFAPALAAPAPRPAHSARRSGPRR